MELKVQKLPKQSLVNAQSSSKTEIQGLSSIGYRERISHSRSVYPSQDTSRGSSKDETWGKNNQNTNKIVKDMED